MDKRAISAGLLAAGPYSPAVEAGHFVFCSGQIPFNAQTGELVTSDIEAATEQVLKNLRAVLAAAGLDLTHVVKTTVFLTNMGDFAAMNKAYGRFFVESHPARSAVAVAALPRGAMVEIEAIALRP